MVPTLWDTPCLTTPFWREQSFGPQTASAPNMMWIQEVWDGAQEVTRLPNSQAVLMMWSRVLTSGKTS